MRQSSQSTFTHQELSHLVMAFLALIWQAISAVTAWQSAHYGDFVMGVAGVLACVIAVFILATRYTENAVEMLWRWAVPATALWLAAHLADELLLDHRVDFTVHCNFLILATLAFTLWPLRWALPMVGVSFGMLVPVTMHSGAVDLNLLNWVGFTAALIGFRSFYSRQLHGASQRVQEAESMMVRDKVTGLLVRSAATAQIRSLLKSESGGPDDQHLALILLAVERLGEINREYGHGSGDRTLQMVSIVLLRHCGPKDLVCRWDGAKFLLLFMNANRREATGRITQILETLNAEAWPGGPKMIVKAGLGMLSEGEQLADVLEIVEDRLRAARQEQKNTLITTTPQSENQSAANGLS